MAVRRLAPFNPHITNTTPTFKNKRKPHEHANTNPLPSRTNYSNPNGHKALKSFHYNSHYHYPLKQTGVVKVKEGPNQKRKYSITELEEDGNAVNDAEGGVCVYEDGISYRVPGAPFEFQFSYSETPKMKPLALREPPFVPFGPTTMPRPWTGGPPLAQSKKNRNSKFPLPQKQGVPHFRQPDIAGSRGDRRTRELILGKPLSKKEIEELVMSCRSGNRQVNLGRNGFTHNMLELIHEHWRHKSICKIKCKGVPTIDMDNVCHHIEDKTGGKIIYRAGGVVYLFRGRNYDHKTRPRFPLMLWKPAAPVYPKLIEPAPAGLTEAEANELRRKGQYVLSICKLAKNGVYVNLVKDVREIFEVSEMVRINCQGLSPSDYKKIGAKLRDLVPCVLLSFDNEHILMWRGKDWE